MIIVVAYYISCCDLLRDVKIYTLLAHFSVIILRQNFERNIVLVEQRWFKIEEKGIKRRAHRCVGVA